MTMIMTDKAIRIAINLFLFVVMILMSSIFPGIANAQSFFRGTVTLPYEVHWGQADLQPGDYLILVSSLSQPAKIYSKSGKQMVFAIAQFTNLNSKDGTCLIITAIGNKHVVNSLNLPYSGISLIYKPVTKMQREIADKADQVQDPVVVAAWK